MAPKTLNQIISGANNFNLLRLLAALTVMLGHAYELADNQGRMDPIRAVTGGMEWAGSMGVFVFFLISGILVPASYDRQQSATRFVLLRAARIYPAMIVFTLISFFVLGPWLTFLPLSDYFASPLIWDFLQYNLLIVPVAMQNLPGLFTHNHTPDAFNNSLWTLPLEVKCYAVALLIGVVARLARQRWVTVFTVAGFYLTFEWLRHNAAVSDGGVLTDIFKLQNGYGYFPFVVFLLGIALYRFVRDVPIDWKYSLIFLAGSLLLDGNPWRISFYALAVMLVLCIAGSTWLTKLRLPDDYSYGVYLWSFPVQQAVNQFLPEFNWWQNLYTALPITIALAMLSWHLVERPVLHRARQRISRQEPVQQLYDQAGTKE